MTVLALTFWTSIALLLYIYAGYPLLAWLLGRFLRKKVRAAEPETFVPTVTILIAAFNEAAHIVGTIENKLALDYPAEALEIIVVSDGSTDGTDELVRGIADPRVRLIRQEPRAGKTAGLNLIMPEATGEIVVFSDANSLYHRDTLRQLVAVLADPAVGYVTGRMVYKAPDGSLTGEACSAYMTYENQLRSWETRLGSIVGVDGGVDAMRRSLYLPMRADQLPDFVQPLLVRQQGFRVVYAEQALLYEETLAEANDEFRMRVRVGLRAFHALKDMAALLNPLRFGVFAWQLWSHKVLRYLAFTWQLVALATNVLLIQGGNPNWRILLAGQILFYLLAVVGHLNRRRGSGRLIGMSYYLCVVNLASAIACWQFLLGRKVVTWKPRT